MGRILRHCPNCDGEVVVWDDDLQADKCIDCGETFPLEQQEIVAEMYGEDLTNGDNAKAIRKQAEEMVAKHRQPPSQLNVTTYERIWPSQIMLNGLLYLPENTGFEVEDKEEAKNGTGK